MLLVKVEIFISGLKFYIFKPVHWCSVLIIQVDNTEYKNVMSVYLELNCMVSLEENIANFILNVTVTSVKLVHVGKGLFCISNY